MSYVSRDELLSQLRQMGDSEARQLFAEARGQDATTKKEKAAQALHEWIFGTTRTEPDTEE